MLYISQTALKYVLYIRNFKYAHLTPIIRLHNIHLEFLKGYCVLNKKKQF